MNAIAYTEKRAEKSSAAGAMVPVPARYEAPGSRPYGNPGAGIPLLKQNRRLNKTDLIMLQPVIHLQQICQQLRTRHKLPVKGSCII